MAAISRGRLGDPTIEITVTEAGPIGLQFSKKRNRRTNLTAMEVVGFKREYERTQAAVQLEQLGVPSDGSAGLGGMILKSITNREDGEVEPFYYGATHGTEGAGAGSKEVAALLDGPVVFELETKQHYESRPHGMQKLWAQMFPEEQEAIRLLGWTEPSWEAAEDGPLRSTWQELGQAKQLAAQSLGYQAEDFGQVSDDEDDAAGIAHLGASSDDDDVDLLDSATAVPQSTPHAAVDDSVESLDEMDLFSKPAPTATPTPKECLQKVRQRTVYEPAPQHAAEEPASVRGSTDEADAAKAKKAKMAAIVRAKGLEMEPSVSLPSPTESVGEVRRTHSVPSHFHIQSRSVLTITKVFILFNLCKSVH